MATEIAETGSFALSSVDPLVEQVREFEEKILSTAKGMRRDMNAMFLLTKLEQRLQAFAPGIEDYYLR